MKSLIVTVFTCLLSLNAFSQNDDLVRLFVSKADIAYLDVHVDQLQESLDVVQEAYKKADDYTIGQTKGDIVKVAHTAPTMFANIYTAAHQTEIDPDVMGSRHDLNYEDYAKMMEADGNYEEIELLPEEIAILRKLVSSSNSIKYKLKESNYAIHESQRAQNSSQNVEMLNQLSYYLAEAYEILQIGVNR